MTSEAATEEGKRHPLRPSRTFKGSSSVREHKATAHSGAGFLRRPQAAWGVGAGGGGDVATPTGVNIFIPKAEARVWVATPHRPSAAVQAQGSGSTPPRVHTCWTGWPRLAAMSRCRCGLKIPVRVCSASKRVSLSNRTASPSPGDGSGGS